MEKIFKIFNKEYVNINQAALLLGCFAFLSQILALFRDRAFAHFIGPSATLDIYYAAFRIPDLIFISVASLASITVLIPFLVAKMNGDAVTSEARKFLNDIFTAFFLVMIGVSITVFFLMPYLVSFIAPGFDPLLQTKVVVLSRIMLLSPILMGLSNLFGTVTQLFRKFFIYSLSPIFYNLGIIIGVMFFYSIWGIYGLAMGVVFGALMHFIIQVFASTTFGFTPQFSFSLNLQSVPLNIIGISYAVAAFPTLAKSVSLGKMDEFKEHLKGAARAIVFWSLPVMFLFIVVRAQIVRVILGSGSFSWENTRLVAASLAIFSVSVVAQGMIALLSRAYYAKGDTKTPLTVNLICSILIIILSFIFINLFENMILFRFFIESILKVADISGTQVLMLPLAYSLGTIVNSIVLWFFVRRDFMKGDSFITKTFFQSLGAAFFLGLVAYLSLNILSPIFGTTTFWGVFFQGFISGILGIFVAIFVLYFLNNEELKDIVKTFKTKFWRAKVVAPSQEGL